MIQGATPHVGKRRDLDCLFLEQLGHAIETHQIVQGVVQGPEVWIHLLGEIAGQKSQALARLDSRAREYDARHLLALERVHGARNGKIGLAGSRRTNAEGDVVFLDLPEILHLPCGTPVQVALARKQRRRRLRRLTSICEFHQAELNLVDSQSVSRDFIEVLQRLHRALRLHGKPGKAEPLPTTRDRNIVSRLDLAQILVQRAAQVGESLVVDRIEGDFECFAFQEQRRLAVSRRTTSPRRL